MVVVPGDDRRLLRYGAGLDPFTAVAIATLAAVVISFVASRYWTFRRREHGGLGRETVLFCPRDVVPLLVLQEMGLAPEPVSCC